VTACRKKSVEGEITKGHEETFRGGEYFIILILVIVFVFYNTED
jgi:hypothetical protein